MCWLFRAGNLVRRERFVACLRLCRLNLGSERQWRQAEVSQLHKWPGALRSLSRNNNDVRGLNRGERQFVKTRGRQDAHDFALRLATRHRPASARGFEPKPRAFRRADARRHKRNRRLRAQNRGPLTTLTCRSFSAANACSWNCYSERGGYRYSLSKLILERPAHPFFRPRLRK